MAVLAARVGAEEAKTRSHRRRGGVLAREEEGQEVVDDGLFGPPTKKRKLDQNAPVFLGGNMIKTIVYVCVQYVYVYIYIYIYM